MKRVINQNPRLLRSSFGRFASTNSKVVVPLINSVQSSVPLPLHLLSADPAGKPHYGEKQSFAQYESIIQRTIAKGGKSYVLKSEKSEENQDVTPENTEKDNAKEENDGEPLSKDKQEQKKEEISKDKKEQTKNETAKTNTAGASSPSSSSSSSTTNSGSSGANGKPPIRPENIENFPELLAVPVVSRPLFPGFYKPLTVRDPQVIKAIEEMIEQKQEYIACFVLKNSEKDTDIITSKDEVYETGVLAQITKFIEHNDNSVTIIVYPHRRVHFDEITQVPTVKSDNDAATALPEENQQDLKKSGKPITKVAETSDKENEASESNIVEDTPEPTAFLKKFNVTLVKVSGLKDQVVERTPNVNATIAEILKVFKDIANYNALFKDQISEFAQGAGASSPNAFEEPAKLADFAAAVSAGEDVELQEILEELDIEQRLLKSLMVLKKEYMTAQLQSKIAKDVENKIQKRQKEYYLMEQLKGIKAELGIDDGRDKLIQSFKDKAAKLQMPENVAKVFNDEITKLNTLETSMSEYGVVRNYLDWITSIPWGITSKEQYNINEAKKILDRDHYGMKDVKDRILEFIAVSKLLGRVSGKIICFVGPPGVGKTSIGKSIASSLHRKFSRFSVGGMTDVAEIKGHRRTYIGALPGRIVQSMKKCETTNPLILIDEIDKIGHGGVHGDPSAALLELLDPEQNNAFLDNYLDIPIDLSKVLFVCTANTLDTIPRPLLDRMEVIEVSGYVEDEKLQIVNNYLSPTAKKSNGLANAHVNLSDEAVLSLIKNYCRESGVRNLKKHVEKIYRKAALKIVNDLGISEVETVPETKSSESKEMQTKVADKAITPKEEDPKVIDASEIAEVKPLVVPETVKIDIDDSNLKDYVGPPIYTKDRLYEVTPPGVVMGLAWTSMGGCSLYVESVLEQPLVNTKHPSFERTGQLGDVMKESSRLAYSFSKMFLSKKFPENRFFEQASIHLHCPEGAIPKDGPSAGVTMASSFLSLALNRSIAPTVAMTGELTLTGRVLRIGGLKEKAIAAKRSGAKTIIFPIDNLSDWEDLPEKVKEGLEPLPAEWYGQIYDKLFPDISLKEGNEVWLTDFEKIDAKEKGKKN